MPLTTPAPADNATSVSKDATLAWVDTGANTAFDVYFGTNEADVTAKSNDVYRGEVSTAAYDPRISLTYSDEYFWLIVGVTDAQETGLLSFTVIAEDAAKPDAKNYSKKLCAAADDAFWYENSDSPPKMVELAGLTLDTSKALTMFELQQKVYIANDDTLKVVDFVNTKLKLTGLLVEPTRGSTVTQATSNATMIVDFVTGTGSGDNYIYGRTTSGTFVTTGGYTLSGGGMTGTLVPSAVTESTTPHYYDWTPYANDTTTYGSMPSRATIGVNYRGRASLTGNSIDPHQWYKSRQANPYDWLYAADDAQSAVAGTDASAGKVGDIITAEMPYSDDYEIFGSIGSLYLVRGDPADGGSLDMYNNKIGVVTQQAWCWDDQGNLYILDLKGLYKIHAGLSRTEPLTSDKIPNFTKDLALNPNTQRIVLSFDTDRQGVQICVTEIETGVNSNYWYDFQSEGFFPETYPEEDGVFCSFHYNADDPDTRKTLFGCSDGHIRIMDEATKSDDTGSIATPSSEAIDSYVLLGPIMIGKDHDYKGILNSLTVVTAGGAAGGTVPDSDDIDWEIIVGETAESIIEQLDAGTKLWSGEITAPGRAKPIRRRSKGVFLGIRLGNDDADETWGLERTLCNILPGGRVK